ncbi:hypothetical protein MCEMSE6_02939 [Oxalobacteraceae bacterium]
MESAKLEDMVKGWFVGNFHPTAFCTSACEVSVKAYKAGDSEPVHHHKVATEITLILSGRVRMGGKYWETGDIVVLAPGDSTEFEAITDSVNVVVKVPSVAGDKYIEKV